MQFDEYVVCDASGVKNVVYDVPSASLDEQLDAIDLQIRSLTDEEIVFDLIGVDVSIANALRRIMMVEVPTMAVETCHIYQNTGVLQDEVLCHRIGLVPFRVNPNDYHFRKSSDIFSSENSLAFQLNVMCPQGAPVMNIYSRMLNWVPFSEDEREACKDPPRLVHDDILITKLAAGQEIEATFYLEKGTGKTHAKWSPVCTASYRLLSILRLKRREDGLLCELTAEELTELRELQSDLTFDPVSGEAAIVRNNAVYHVALERFPEKLEHLRKKRHFRFTVESTGALPALQIVQSALQLLLSKLATLKKQFSLSA
uniref:DNA-directed RNA polymerases I and III subunit rpac1-like n=1 Tax=Dermatophagoides pteronyssinus TaxID=6956 RepID=A0A6P6Y5Z5_DERPT|nr:DNA-directed RNA polymerases I and III subunit rpac1-like [Dermatophagoides pteronyssinus]